MDCRVAAFGLDCPLANPITPVYRTKYACIIQHHLANHTNRHDSYIGRTTPIHSLNSDSITTLNFTSKHILRWLIIPLPAQHPKTAIYETFILGTFPVVGCAHHPIVSASHLAFPSILRASDMTRMLGGHQTQASYSPLRCNRIWRGEK